MISEIELAEQADDMSPSNNISLQRTKTHVSAGLERLLNGTVK